MIHTKGPEIHINEVREKLHVKVGDKFTMMAEKGKYKDTEKLSVNYKVKKEVVVGDIIVIGS